MPPLRLIARGVSVLILAVLAPVLSTCAKDPLPVDPAGPNDPPTQPASPVPADDAIVSARQLTLRWSVSDPDGDALSFDVYFGTTNPPTSSAKRTSPSYTVTGLNYSTDYYWKVDATDPDLKKRSGSVWHFRTSVNSAPTVRDTIPDASVVVGTASIANYSDLNSVFRDAQDGSALAFTIQSNSNPALVAVTIDADSALDFSFTPGTTGSATIVIRATDSGGLPGGLSIAEGFGVDVTPVPPGGIIGIYADQAGTVCSTVDGPLNTVRTVYIVHHSTGGVTASQFKVEAVGTSWSFLSYANAPGTLHIGDPLTGLQVAYGACKTGSVAVGSMNYFYGGPASDPCARLRVVPDPAAGSGIIEAVDCSSNLVEALGRPLIINPNGSCPCPPPPASPSAWQQIRALSGASGR